MMNERGELLCVYTCLLVSNRFFLLFMFALCVCTRLEKQINEEIKDYIIFSYPVRSMLSVADDNMTTCGMCVCVLCEI